jgi:hypothetical protein
LFSKHKSTDLIMKLIEPILEENRKLKEELNVIVHNGLPV